MAQYQSEISIGSKYRDQSGIEGKAVVISFHEHACERVVLEYRADNDLKAIEVDAARLTLVEPLPQPVPVRTGASTTPRQQAGRRR